jgi:2'-5' RNA ligase
VSAEKSGRLRLFISLNLPPAVGAVVTKFQGQLKESVRNELIRWTPPEQIHLTLRFLGSVAADSVPDLEAALRRVCEVAPPFELSTGGVGCFPNDARPRVVWMGLGGSLDALRSLVTNIGKATSAWGENEERDFHPHLTLGRVKPGRPSDLRKLGDELRGVHPPHAGVGRVTQVDVMRSDLFPDGARHAVVATIRFPLP